MGFGKDEPVQTGLSAEQFKELLKALAAPKPMNPIEERKYLEELEREDRRNKLTYELGKAEEEALRRKRDSCSHSRDRITGDSVTKGTGVWLTQGQKHGDQTITLICMRCATTWHFRATPEELDRIDNGAMLGYPPPPDSRLIA